MRKQFYHFTPIILILIAAGWIIASVTYPQQVVAQGSDLDTILARAAVKGYLTSLKVTSSGSPTLTNFYLTPDASSSGIVQSLNNLPVESFEITQESWLDDNTYQATVSISPGNRVLVATASKPESRWQITSLAWDGDSPTTSPPSTTADTTTETITETTSPAPASTTTETSNATSVPEGDVIIGTNTTPPTPPPATAEVVSRQLNLRIGPGVIYPISRTLNQGDVVDIVGINSTDEWYQVAQDGVIIGWVSALPAYVATSPANFDVPTVWVPRLSTSDAGGTPNSSANISPGSRADVPSGTSVGGKLILQGSSGEDFYLVNADGSGLRRISSGIDPALSPDGNQVAFTRWGNGEAGSLWIHDLATGEERHILGEIPQAKSPTWSPDGSRVVVSFQHGGRRNVETQCKNRGEPIPDEAYDFNFGSESGRICYKLPADTFWHLREVELATGTYQDLPSDRYSFAPTWDPANDWRVVFAAPMGLQQLDLNRDVYFPFTTDLRHHAPLFSPDGSKVAVTYRQHQHWEVYVIDVATGNQARLTAPSILADRQYNSAAPAWSPDGQQIAFVTDRTGQWEFWEMNADGSDPRPLLSPEVAAKIPVEYRGVDERLISWGK